MADFPARDADDVDTVQHRYRRLAKKRIAFRRVAISFTGQAWRTTRASLARVATSTGFATPARCAPCSRGAGHRVAGGDRADDGRGGVHLERLPSPDLGLLPARPCLSVASVENVIGDVDWRALERLRGVRTLRLEVADAAAAAVAALDFGALAALEMLALVTSVPTPLDVAGPRGSNVSAGFSWRGSSCPPGQDQPLCDAARAGPMPPFSIPPATRTIRGQRSESSSSRSPA